VVGGSSADCVRRYVRRTRPRINRPTGWRSQPRSDSQRPRCVL